MNKGVVPYIIGIIFIILYGYRTFMLQTRIEGLEKRVSELIYEREAEKVVVASEKKSRGNGEFMEFTGLKKQLLALKGEMRKLKGKKSEASGEDERSMGDLVRDMNETLLRSSSEYMRAFFEQKGFSREDNDTVMKNYEAMFKDLESVQMRWIGGKIMWEEIPEEVRDSYLQFYHGLQHDLGESKGRVVFNYFVPDPNIRKFILEEN